MLSSTASGKIVTMCIFVFTEMMKILCPHVKIIPARRYFCQAGKFWGVASR